MAFAGAAARSSLAAPYVLKKGSKLTFWSGLVFSDKANKYAVDMVNKWGAANGIATEVLVINNNETVQKVSAAVASGTMPDAFDLGLDLLLLLTRQNVLLPIDDVFNNVGKAHGGWIPSVAAATDTSKGGEGRTGLPFGAGGNLILRRKDLLDKAGFTTAPKTWEEMVTQSVAVTKGTVFGMGLALSNVGDGNLQTSVMQSYGGRVGDEQGKNAAIKSEGTRAYLAWVKDAWDKKLFPPGATTWDGAGDNQAYLSGQAAFIANTGSVAIQARSQDPELFEATGYSPLPDGPKGKVAPINLVLRAIPRTSQNPEAAKALLEYMATPEYIEGYYAEAIYAPVLQSQLKLKPFDGKNPVLAGLTELVLSGTPPAYPDLYNAAFAETQINFIVPKMIQRVVIDGYDFDRAMNEAQASAQAIYDKYK